MTILTVNTLAIYSRGLLSLCCLSDAVDEAQFTAGVFANRIFSTKYLSTLDILYSDCRTINARYVYDLQHEDAHERLIVLITYNDAQQIWPDYLNYLCR